MGNLYLFVFNSQVNRVDLLGLNAYVANAGGYTGHTSFVVDNPAGGIIAYHFFAAHQSAAAPWYTEALPLAYGSVRIWPQPASRLDEYLAKEGANYGDISIWAVGLGTQNDDAMAIQRMNQEIEDQDGYYSLLGGRECHRQSWYWFHDYTCAGRDVPTSQILGLTQPVINEKPIALPDRFTLTHDLSLPQFSWFGP